MPDFTSIIYELELTPGTWTDISSDVLQDPTPKFSRGTMSNDVDDLTSDPGALTFSLDNSAANSAGLLGYYSPGHANCRAGWMASIRVRIRFVWDKLDIVKWIGRIDPDGIHVIPGTLGVRRVDVTASDWMKHASDYKINLLPYTSNKTAKQATNIILDYMPIRPTTIHNATDDHPADPYYSDYIMPLVFDTTQTDTTALGEFQKIAMACRREFYLQGGNGGENLLIERIGGAESADGGTPAPDYAKRVAVPVARCTTPLTDESSNQLTDESGDPLYEDATELITLDDTDYLDASISYGNHLYNYLTISTYPRRMDAGTTTVLWTMQSAQQLNAGQSVTIRAAYRDATSASRVNCAYLTAPVSGTDYKAYANSDGTGTNYTSSMDVVVSPGTGTNCGPAETELKITNTHATDSFYFGGPSITLQLRGRGVYTWDTVRQVEADQDSIDLYGVIPYNADMKYNQNIGSSNPLIGYFNTVYPHPRYEWDTITLSPNRDETNMQAFLCWEPGDQIQLADTMTAIASGHQIAAYSPRIQGYEAEILEGKIVKWTIATKNGGA